MNAQASGTTAESLNKILRKFHRELFSFLHEQLTEKNRKNSFQVYRSQNAVWEYVHTKENKRWSTYRSLSLAWMPKKCRPISTTHNFWSLKKQINVNIINPVILHQDLHREIGERRNQRHTVCADLPSGSSVTKRWVAAIHLKFVGPNELPFFAVWRTPSVHDVLQSVDHRHPFLQKTKKRKQKSTALEIYNLLNSMAVMISLMKLVSLWGLENEKSIHADYNFSQ